MVAHCIVVGVHHEQHVLRHFTIEVDKLQKAWPEKDSLIPLPRCQSVWQVNDEDAAKRVLTVELRTRASNCGCASCTPLKVGAFKHYWPQCGSLGVVLFGADALLQ